jgi:hypothetical protein
MRLPAVHRAIAGYERVHGTGAPQPSRAASYVTVVHQRTYIVLGTPRTILSCYRLHRGSLLLLLRWPKTLDAQHAAASMRHAVA